MSATASAIGYGTSEAGRAALLERDPQVNGKEMPCARIGQRGKGKNDEPSGVGAAGELVNAGGNYVGLAEITPRKIVMPP